jgi:hypothetical protein
VKVVERRHRFHSSITRVRACVSVASRRRHHQRAPHARRVVVARGTFATRMTTKPYDDGVRATTTRAEANSSAMNSEVGFV